MRRGVVVLALGLVGAGWRGDGTGIVAATPPADWSEAGPVAWRTSLPSWSNATPVVAGGLVCVAWEPAGLSCLDAATGAVRWSVTTDRIDALPLDQQAAKRAVVAGVAGKDEALRQLQVDYSRLRTELRRDPQGTAAARIETTMAQLAQVRAELDAVAMWRVPPSPAVVGWTTPTPVAVQGVIYQALSFGVVTALDLTGKRLWVRDLGMPSERRRGHDGPDTASPVLVGDVLVVVHDRLIGLDRHTGATLWTSVPTPDFGTPAVVRVGARSLLALPDGALIDPVDGRVLASDLGSVWYAGAYAVGDVACWVGSAADHMRRVPAQAACVRVAAQGSEVAVVPLWQRTLSVTDTFYADPVAWGAHLVAVSRHGQAVVLRLADGEVVRTVDLALPLSTEVWASPAVVGGALVVAGDAGDVRIYTSPELVAPRVAAGSRTLVAPLFVGDRVYLRTAEALVAVGGRPLSSPR